jgi:siroheme synthase (precorrin-2 oxidase/ferrochelatase)
MIDTTTISLIGALSGLVVSITALVNSIRTKQGVKTRIHNLRNESQGHLANFDNRIAELVEALRADVDNKTRDAMLEGIVTGHRIARAQQEEEASG